MRDESFQFDFSSVPAFLIEMFARRGRDEVPLHLKKGSLLLKNPEGDYIVCSPVLRIVFN